MAEYFEGKNSENASSHAYHDQTIKILCKNENTAQPRRSKESEWEMCDLFANKTVAQCPQTKKLLSVNYSHCIYYDRIRFYFVLLASLHYYILRWITFAQQFVISVWIFIISDELKVITFILVKNLKFLIKIPKLSSLLHNGSSNFIVLLFSYCSLSSVIH